jgi:hypothetical protein
MMPVPSHLQGLVVPLDDAIDEAALAADVRCPCGEAVFDLFYPGQNHKYEGETVPCTAEIEPTRVQSSTHGRGALIVKAMHP